MNACILQLLLFILCSHISSSLDNLDSRSALGSLLFVNIEERFEFEEISDIFEWIEYRLSVLLLLSVSKYSSFLLNIFSSDCMRLEKEVKDNRFLMFVFDNLV